MKPGIDHIGVAVCALILNENKEIFLAKRSQNCRNGKGYWEAPGGKVEFGERLADAIKREIYEEHGVEIEILKQFPAMDHIVPEEQQHWVTTAFVVGIEGEQAPKIMESDKCDAVGFFALDNLPQPLASITKIDIDYFIKQRSLQD